MITIPLFIPVIMTPGLDPVWFEQLMLIVPEISLATPHGNRILLHRVSPDIITSDNFGE